MNMSGLEDSKKDEVKPPTTSSAESMKSSSVPSAPVSNAAVKDAKVSNHAPIIESIQFTHALCSIHNTLFNKICYYKKQHDFR